MSGVTCDNPGCCSEGCCDMTGSGGHHMDPTCLISKARWQARAKPPAAAVEHDETTMLKEICQEQQAPTFHLDTMHTDGMPFLTSHLDGHSTLWMCCCGEHQTRKHDNDCKAIEPFNKTGVAVIKSTSVQISSFGS